jgi:Uma2 family endonuclease
MTQALEQQTYTREEYLDFEVASEERHEYVNGEIRLMTGGTPDHNKLALNLATLLKSALRGNPYRTFGADQRLRQITMAFPPRSLNRLLHRLVRWRSYSAATILQILHALVYLMRSPHLPKTVLFWSPWAIMRIT